MEFFDSNAHPTLDGSWTTEFSSETSVRRGMSFQDLASIKIANPGYNALAVGLPGVGGYEHRSFKRECDRWGLEGIAAITTLEQLKTEREIELIHNLGFRGVKVHPRLLGKNTDLSFTSRIFSACNEFGLVCMLCTYEADVPGKLPRTDPFYQVCDALNEVPEIRLILMHGGGPRLMSYAGLARHSETILIDLSFTIMDFMTSTLKPLIRDLVSNLDRRLCVGSDSPEFAAVDVLGRVCEITRDVPTNKLENALSKNLQRFFSSHAQP